LGNAAANGGAAYLGSFSGCLASNNEAKTCGGATCYTTASNSVITQCRAQYGGGMYGGAAFCSSLLGNQSTQYYGGGAAQMTMDRCLVLENSAVGNGGGLYGGTAQNSLFLGNQAGGDGGGMNNSALIYCTVISNRAYRGGGSYSGSMTNSIVYYNAATYESNNACNTISWFSCLYPSVPTNGNITNAPTFVDMATADYRLAASSPCIDAGTNINLGKDLTGLLRPQDGNSDGLFYSDMGAYEYAPTHLVHYASKTGLNSYPYTNWNGAATTLQAAVDAATAGDTIWVSNGVYAAGGRVVDGSMSNRVAVLQGILIKSTSGSQLTTIAGAGPIGDSAVRCAYLTSGAVLDGFALSNGHTRATGTWFTEQVGGGAWCADDAVLKNCVFIDNSANNSAGALWHGKALSCTFTNNSAYNAGAVRSAWVSNSVVIANRADEDGGGAYDSTLTNCDIIGNIASNSGGTGVGGGAYNCALYDCRVIGNYARNSAGGVYGGTVSHCVVSTNRSQSSGGGVYSAFVSSSTISSNYTAGSGGAAAYCEIRDSALLYNTSATAGGGNMVLQQLVFRRGRRRIFDNSHQLHAP
jgi:hypothetical protein